MFSIQGPSLCKTSTENFKIENASAVEPAEMAEAVSVKEDFLRAVTTITLKKRCTCKNLRVPDLLGTVGTAVDLCVSTHFSFSLNMWNSEFSTPEYQKY